MKRHYISVPVIVIAAVALFFIMSGQSTAMIYSDDTFQLTGKLEAKAAFFTDNAKGYTYPQFKSWDMFKQRNMAYLQADHDLQKLTGLELQYHLVGRVIYEGIYDYGPKVFRQAYDNNKDAFDRYNLKLQYALWEAYVNYSKGGFNLRVGRQNLSWGEMDVMRVTDHINPLDNTWGGSGTESLDDRRIPLWMIRAAYQANAKLSIETFLVPGAIDTTVAPNTPFGSPYGAAVPDLGYYTSLLTAGRVYATFNHGLGAVTEPTRDMSSSRVGFKLTSYIADTTVTASYQRTYWDAQIQRYRTTTGATINYFNPGGWSQENEYPKVNIFAMTASHVFADYDFILKGELAHTQGAPIYIGSINKPLTLGFGTTSVSPGEYTKRDRTDFGINFAKDFWIRAINNGNRLSFMVEYYGTYWHNFDGRMQFPVLRPDGGFDSAKRYDQIVDFSISSNWYNKTNASLAAIYDARGVWLLIPKLSYKFNNPLTVEFQYSRTSGVWTNSGCMADRDQVSALLRWEL